jgi:small nuclear ribonucleoprotein (snRNP)-like protein
LIFYLFSTMSSSSSDCVELGPNYLRRLLNRNMKVKITDGRIIVGTFVCTDKASNIILSGSQEYIDSNSSGKYYYKLYIMHAIKTTTICAHAAVAYINVMLCVACALNLILSSLFAIK